jgi:hypothetical protein
MKNTNKLTISDLGDNTFASARFIDNNIAELREALKIRAADQTDCRTFSLDNWRIAF